MSTELAFKLKTLNYIQFKNLMHVLMVLETLKTMDLDR